MLVLLNLCRNSKYYSLFFNFFLEKLIAFFRIGIREMKSIDDLKTDDYRFYVDINVMEIRMLFWFFGYNEIKY